MYSRYRYDTETGLYYLQSRYYNPEWGRFVNADVIVGESGTLLSHNMFSYCANDPVNMEDESGYWAVKVQRKDTEFAGFASIGSTAKMAPSSRSVPSLSKSENLTSRTFTISRPSTLNPNEINFMQSSAKNSTGEYTVLGNAQALQNGTLSPSDLPPIRVWKGISGKIYTLDHRRLIAFKLSGTSNIPVKWAPQSVVIKNDFKWSTVNGGTSIKLKLGNGSSMTVE